MYKFVTREGNSALLASPRKPWTLLLINSTDWSWECQYKAAPVLAAAQALTFPFFFLSSPLSFFHCNSECIFARYPWNYYYYIAILDQCSGNTLQIVMAFASWCLPYCLVESNLIPRLKCLFHFSKTLCLLPLHKRLPISGFVLAPSTGVSGSLMKKTSTH